ncbi:protein Dr1-like [Xenia sp. Carnegie-2017]|uniref:protein Dr1-like n=1 Tax=Xenia sp. Carnegie-2017 TaxID=2897299 RepID=UPI001F038B8A|nr:protein Dr1-like [Xenia sp. Carnegie-2017]XP_046859495.1 protein Dr1-like [Xenia sp. Carnegie-2017]XP_046859496.1 protein Dr1-like [Xenia sp. Carnegie-2017]
MADFDGGGVGQEDDVTLPRAAVNKLIKEMIPNVRVSNDARELILNCCTEFIHLVSSEANEVCKQRAKKTIAPEHIIDALKSLGFTSYIQEVESVYTDYKKQAINKRRGSNRLENLGIPEEELLRQQEALFAQARLEQAQVEQEQFLQAQSVAAQTSSQTTSIPISVLTSSVNNAQSPNLPTP